MAGPTIDRAAEPVADTVDDRRGLTGDEARRRLEADGPNRLPETKPPSAAAELGAQLVHFFALMLWVAAGLAWLADLPALTVAIAAVVVVNALFAFAQERRADHAAERLRVLLPTRVSVRRDGASKVIDAADVVRGDVLVIDAGDRIPADGRVVLSNALMVDTSLLTGESGSTTADRGDDVWAGTFAVAGDGEIVVAATGSATRLAHIASLTSATPKPKTPLTIELARVVRTVAAIAVGIGGAFFVLVWLLGRPVDEGVVFAIGVTVALVPEALLPTVTLSLAWGAEQMAGRQVLVRSLEAVETLGSTTYVCTDKTGTLTRNEMTVVEAWTANGSATASGLGYEPDAAVELSEPGARDALCDLAIAGVAASTGFASQRVAAGSDAAGSDAAGSDAAGSDEAGSDAAGSGAGAWTANGEPMDAAIDAFARRLGLDTEPVRAQCVGRTRFPFDAKRRTTSIVTDERIVVKGAPDAVIPLCARTPRLVRDAAAEVVAGLARRGLRVLAIAGKPVEVRIDDRSSAVTHTAATVAEVAAEVDLRSNVTRDAIESDLELYGLVALEDPPREGVADALAACRRAGVRVAMLTGDHPVTAEAIAERVGLLGADRTVVLGDALPADDGVLGAMLDRDGVVIARVAPEDKLRIARVLRARGHVVAMTGDGVNDAPALHEADIGIAMGRSGTDVAREAADLVLLDDHFASIVGGIEQGRTTFINVRRFLTYHLTDNVAELTPFVVWALSGGRFPLALGVLQILALDLGTDTLSAVALGAEPPGRHILDGPPVSGRLLNATVARRSFGLIGPVIAALTMVAFLVSLAVDGWRPGEEFPVGHAVAVASGAAFMTVVLGQKANAFACRSTSRTPGELGWFTNRLLPAAGLIELAFAVVVITVPAIADELDHAVPSLAGWAVAVAAIPIVLLVDRLDKRRRRASGAEQQGRTALPGAGLRVG